MYFGAGYNHGFAAHNQLNFIITRYNETNPNLARPMAHMDHLSGPIFSAAILAGNQSIHVDYAKKTTSLFSNYYNAEGNIERTDLKVAADQIGLTFGAFPRPGYNFTFGFGISAQYMRTNYLVKSGELGPKYQQWHHAAAFDQLTLAPMVQFFFGMTKNVFIYLKPSYQFDPFPIDYYNLHKEINPNIYMQDKGRDFEGRLNQFVLEGGLVYSFQVGN